MVSKYGFKMCFLLDFIQYIYYCPDIPPDTYKYMLVICLHRWLYHVLFKWGILKTFVRFALKTKTLAFNYIDGIINFLFPIVFKQKNNYFKMVVV